MFVSNTHSPFSRFQILLLALRRINYTTCFAIFLNHEIRNLRDYFFLHTKRKRNQPITHVIWPDFSSLSFRFYVKKYLQFLCRHKNITHCYFLFIIKHFLLIILEYLVQFLWIQYYFTWSTSNSLVPNRNEIVCLYY